MSARTEAVTVRVPVRTCPRCTAALAPDADKRERFCAVCAHLDSEAYRTVAQYGKARRLATLLLGRSVTPMQAAALDETGWGHAARLLGDTLPSETTRTLALLLMQEGSR